MEETKVYIKRKADQYLAEWKADSQRKPLIVKGARQIGKTETILHFTSSNYENVVYINFVTDEKYKVITKDGLQGLPAITMIDLKGKDELPPNVSLLDNDLLPNGIRRFWWEFDYPNPNDIVGRIIECQFFEETHDKDGNLSLRFPIFKTIRNDKNEKYF